MIVVDILPRVAPLEPRLRLGGRPARAGASAGDGVRLASPAVGTMSEHFG